jgi:hypothetical protein
MYATIGRPCNGIFRDVLRRGVGKRLLHRLVSLRRCLIRTPSRCAHFQTPLSESNEDFTPATTTHVLSLSGCCCRSIGAEALNHLSLLHRVTARPLMQVREYRNMACAQPPGEAVAQSFHGPIVGDASRFLLSSSPPSLLLRPPTVEPC